ncbi:hypothetical protein [Pelagimonas varians]|uniref:Uncharacterized protein n=1 Tax=Pelagimonas varians TaxID=696760 RepID=A0A238KF23_9RHOB|nr:hypothetical protein [Pelagimonas varians]PYG32417.1 hypothetical protein C8N36_103166 [Pelagimonas varians]SMX41391.1 hypothetical protein PEV8663_02264 [Pelagimonas varians]
MTQLVLNALTDHYNRLRLQCYVVPGITQADGGPLEIYYDPPTNAQGNEIQTRAKGNTALTTLYTVLLLAKDKDGNRLFDDSAGTVQALTENVPGRVLTGIAAAIMTFSDGAKLGNSSSPAPTPDLSTG